MSGTEFNKDLDSYLKRRRRINEYSMNIESKEDEPVVEEEFSEEEEQLDEPEKPGFFERLKGMFSSEPVEPEEEEDLHIDCREDIKRIGKIALGAIKALPDDDLMDFKNSEKYVELRDILSKYNLIKSNNP